MKMRVGLTCLGYFTLRVDINENMSYFNLFKARVCDQFVQEWQASINSMSKLNYYVKYKKTFEFEPYLNIIGNYMIRKCLTCFRLGSHRLEIELLVLIEKVDYVKYLIQM